MTSLLSFESNYAFLALIEAGTCRLWLQYSASQFVRLVLLKQVLINYFGFLPFDTNQGKPVNF